MLCWVVSLLQGLILIGYGLPDSDTVEVCQVSVSSRHMWQGSLAVKGMQFKVQWYIPDSKTDTSTCL